MGKIKTITWTDDVTGAKHIVDLSYWSCPFCGAALYNWNFLGTHFKCSSCRREGGKEDYIKPEDDRP